jgi:hypothetical protein
VYAIILQFGPRRLNVKIDDSFVKTAQVKSDKFMEYVDVEGIVKPILTIKLNSKESGNVERIIKESGSLVEVGDTILILSNTELERTINDQKDDYQKQLYSHKEKEIAMEQQSLTLQQQTIETQYDINSMHKKIALEKEEYKMGIKTKAQLDISQDEFNYKLKRADLQMKRLKHDSTMNAIRKELLFKDLQREQTKYQRSLERLNNLIIKATIKGQLGSINLVPGQQVSNGENITEIKVLDSYKISTNVNEYYIDRISTNLPASVTYQGTRYPLKVSRVIPEIHNNSFGIDLIFTSNLPDNAKIGKSYRVQIELDQPEETIVIPKGDFFQQTGGKWIYKINKSGTKATKVSITIGRQNPKQYEILEGLKDGDSVIVTGYEKFGDVDELILKN